MRRCPCTAEMDLLQTYELAWRLQQAPNAEACADIFDAAVRPLGFDTFACGQTDLSDLERNAFYVIRWPPNWRRFYVGSGLIRRDPVVDALRRRREPFTWTDLKRDRTFSKLGREALDLIGAAGWSEGFVAPIPAPGGCIGLVSLAGHIDVKDDATRAYLWFASLAFHGRVRSLAAKHGCAAPPAGLTEREIAGVRLVAEGASDTAIAARLGVAVSTAHEFVEKAKRKLKVRSRAELVRLSVALGTIAG